MFAPGPERDRFEQLTDQAKMVRFGGDCMNYALLASGEVDLVVENQLAVHDIVPLIPIVANAGGVITDRNGLPPVDGGFVIAAANQLLHHQASRILAPETRPSS
jgi:myo-inositol-1(or 4)-monophosphatase